jgi:Fur family ferric uptake transcriptional regulator
MRYCSNRTDPTTMTVKPAARDSKQNLLLAEMQLRNASVRITEARLKVLAALLGSKRAFSHQDVQDTLVGMDRVTLYRALDCLIDAGLAHKIAGDDRVFRYSAGAESGVAHGTGGTGGTSGTSAPHHQHGHFKCTRCSKVFCVDGISESGLLQNALQQSLGKGFQSHDIEVTIKGWCAECAR